MEYIDLGLPSGTKWADSNEDRFYTNDEAVSKYGDSLPTYEQFEELKKQCQWEWTGNGFRVTGPNGNSIVLPASGYRICEGYVHDKGSVGRYWSSSFIGSKYACYLDFYSKCVYMYDGDRCYGFSVRLVK